MGNYVSYITGWVSPSTEAKTETDHELPSSSSESTDYYDADDYEQPACSEVEDTPIPSTLQRKGSGEGNQKQVSISESQLEEGIHVLWIISLIHRPYI